MNTRGSPPPKPKKPSSVRHTRAIARDRSKRPPAAPLDEQVSARLTELIQPLTLAQVAHYHELGLRERVLSLPVMVALVLRPPGRRRARPRCCGPALSPPVRNLPQARRQLLVQLAVRITCPVCLACIPVPTRAAVQCRVGARPPAT